MPDDEDAGNSRDDQRASQATQSTTQTTSIAYDMSAPDTGVISNTTGDRTPNGTSLSINDPLRLNVGDTYSVSFGDSREVYQRNSQ
jgi:hypothetical protein